MVGHDCYKIFLFHIYEFYRVDNFGDSGFAATTSGVPDLPDVISADFGYSFGPLGLRCCFA